MLQPLLLAWGKVTCAGKQWGRWEPCSTADVIVLAKNWLFVFFQKLSYIFVIQSSVFCLDCLNIDSQAISNKMLTLKISRNLPKRWMIIPEIWDEKQKKIFQIFLLYLAYLKYGCHKGVSSRGFISFLCHQHSQHVLGSFQGQLLCKTVLQECILCFNT